MNTKSTTPTSEFECIGVLSITSTDNGKSSFCKVARDYRIETGRPTEYIRFDKADALDEGQEANFDETRINVGVAKLRRPKCDEIVEIGAHIWEGLVAELKLSGGIEKYFTQLILIMKPQAKTEGIMSMINKYITAGIPPKRITIVFNLIPDTHGDRLSDFRGEIDVAKLAGVNVVEEPIGIHKVIAATKGKKFSAFHYADEALARDASDQLLDQSEALWAMPETPETKKELDEIGAELMLWENGPGTKKEICKTLELVFG